MSTPTPAHYFKWFLDGFTSHGLRLGKVKPGDAMIQCPGHQDKNPSLHVTLKGDKILMRCHAGCTDNREGTERVLGLVYMTLKHLYVHDHEHPSLEPDTSAPPSPDSAATPAEPDAGVQAILALDDPLVAVREAIQAQGYGGSLDPPMIVYIAMTTRLLKQRMGSSPCHLLIIATSGAGKTYTEKLVCMFLPETAIHKLMAGSARALIYDHGDLAHRTLLFAEADSLPSDEDNPAASAVRALLQDNELSYDVVVKEPKGKGYVTQKIRRPGPTQFITTSTKRFRDHQMATRVFELEIPTDAQKIRAALKVQAKLINSPAAPPHPALIAFQAYLQQQAPWEVAVPFADALADLIGKRQHDPRILRDFNKLLSLVRAVAVLRHAHRAKDEAGRVVATLADYATIRELVGPMYEAAVTGATPGVRQAVQAVKEGAETVSAVQAAIAGMTGETPYRQSVGRWINQAISHEWMRNLEDGPRKPKRLATGSEEIPQRVLLPSVADLETWVCNMPTRIPEVNVEISNIACGESTYSTSSVSSGKLVGTVADRVTANKNNGLEVTPPPEPATGNMGMLRTSVAELVPVVESRADSAYCTTCQRFRCQCKGSA